MRLIPQDRHIVLVASVDRETRQFVWNSAAPQSAQECADKPALAVAAVRTRRRIRIPLERALDDEAD